jgi:hypothetical protein
LEFLVLEIMYPAEAITIAAIIAVVVADELSFMNEPF